MCAEKSGLANATACQNGNEPINIEISIDINDIYDGALKVLKRVKPFWPINNVKFKVRSTDDSAYLLCDDSVYLLLEEWKNITCLLTICANVSKSRIEFLSHPK